MRALKGIRRLEWLASRLLLHQLTGTSGRMALAKTTASKPFFPDAPALCCSLTHSQGIAGALLTDRPCGCDVQVFTDKLQRLASRFVGREEAAYLEAQTEAHRADLLHILWSAKESLYKADGRKGLAFATQLRVMPFEWDGAHTRTTGWVIREEGATAYSLTAEKVWLPDGRALMLVICLGG